MKTTARQYLACAAQLTALVLLLAMPGFLFGQGGATGTILGTVTDNSGAVVPKAAVEVTNVATNVTKKVETTSSGDFSVPFLNPGTYKVTVQAAGFQRATVASVTLVVAQQARVNVEMKPGAVSENIEVTANAVAIDTDTSAVTQLVSQKQVEDLPLNGRNFQQLLFIGAGAVQTGGEQGTMRAGQGAAISINGSRPESNNYMLDGMLNTDQALNTPAVVLSVDAIQEFKVQSETYSAQYGFTANQINIVSKSGTNQLHGSGFWFGRNDALDAKNYFQASNQPNAKLRQNQFGFVLGGPVYLGKLYDGRNKTFWLANFEGWRITQGTQSFANVPNPDELQGNFATAVIDPTTGAPFPGNGQFASVIPQGRFSNMTQVGLAAGYFPAPNCDPTTCQGNNYRLSTNLPNTTNQQTYRLDQELGKFGKIFGRGTYSTYGINALGTASGQIGQTHFQEQATNWEVSHTISFGPNKVNQFSFGRLNSTTVQGGFPAPASDISKLGLTGVFTTLNSNQSVYPYYSFGNGVGQETLSTFGGQVNAYTFSNNPMWQYSDTFTLILNRHTFSFGADYKRWKLNRDVADNFLGNYTFSGYATGNQVADMLLGYYSAAAAFVPGAFSVAGQAGNPRQFNFQYFAPYAQDDWRVNSRLTVNLGLRWDYRTIPYETNNRMGWLDPTNPLGGMCIADQGLVAAGIAPDGNGFYRYCGSNHPSSAEKKDFGPRIGFAWQPFGDGKTVIRGGYGIFWDGVEGREMDGAADIYPYVSRLNLAQTAGQASYQSTNQLFPSFAAPGPITGGPTGPNSFLAVNLSENPQNPYMQQWTFSVQRELARNTTLEVNYVGNKGTHLLARNNINQAFPMTDPAFCTANPTLGDCPLAARRPYPNFVTYINSIWSGYSSYNAGNVKLERRASSMAVTAVYTWAKSLDDKSAAAGIGAQSFNGWQGFLNNHDPKLDYGRSDFDVGQRFVTSFVYDLPIGRGKRFGTGMNKALNTVAGGWQTTGIVTFQQGFPMSITAGDTTGLLDTFGTNRADINPSAAAGGFSKGLNEYINTAEFSQPAPNTLGNSGRNIVRMPGINNWDIGLLKNVPFSERANLQLRIETFNTFNHPQFNPDPSTAAFAGGGTTVVNNVNAKNFGKVTGAAPGRIVQLGAKISF